MGEVSRKFFIASVFMWILPIAILYGFQHEWFPGFSHVSPYSQTMLSALFAVISVNIMLAFYIFMAVQEPSDKHEPDPVFLAKAKASLKQTLPDGAAKQD